MTRIPKNARKKIRTIADRVVDAKIYDIYYGYNPQPWQYINETAEFKAQLITRCLNQRHTLVVDAERCRASLRGPRNSWIELQLSSTEGL